MRNGKTYLFALLIAFIAVSCQKEADEVWDDVKGLNSTQLEKDKFYISELGFDISTLIDRGDVYVVEGDIVLEKKNLFDYGKLLERKPLISTKQAYSTEGLVSQNKIRNITVGVDSSVPMTSGWNTALASAVQYWSTIPGCAVKLSYITTTNPDITIKRGSFFLNPSVVAEASWPYNDNPGSVIEVNLKYDYFTSLQKVFVMVHELGHCLGLRHTNWETSKEPTAVHIPGTPASDPESVMNKSTGGTSWKGFSKNDVVAIKYLYPFNEKVYFTNIREIKDGSTIRIEAVLNIPGTVELTMQVGLNIASTFENPEVRFNSGTGGSIILNKNNITNPSAATKTFGYVKGTYNVSLILQGINNPSWSQAGVGIIGLKTGDGLNYTIGSPADIAVNSL